MRFNPKIHVQNGIFYKPRNIRRSSMELKNTPYGKIMLND